MLLLGDFLAVQMYPCQLFHLIQFLPLGKVHTTCTFVLIPMCAAAWQAYSEPSRPPTYGRTLEKNKRGDEFSATCYKRRGIVYMWSLTYSINKCFSLIPRFTFYFACVATKKHHVSFRQHALPETLLSGMSVTDEHEVGDELSDSGYHSRTASHNSGID